MHRQTTGLASLLLAAAAAPLWAQDAPPTPPTPDAPPAPEASENPTDPSLELYTQASLLMHKEAYAKARALYGRLVEGFPESPLRPEGLYWLGYCDEQLGKSQQARAAYQRLLEHAPRSQWARDAERRLSVVNLPAPKLGTFTLQPTEGAARQVVVSSLHPQIVLADGQRLAWNDVTTLRRQGEGQRETVVLSNGDQLSGVVVGATSAELELEGEGFGTLKIPHQRVVRVGPQGRAYTASPLYAAPLQTLTRPGAEAEGDRAQLLLELAETHGQKAEGQAARRAALMALAARGDGEADVDVEVRVDGDGRKVIVERRRDKDGNVVVERRVVEGDHDEGDQGAHDHGAEREHTRHMFQVRPGVDEDVEVLLEGEVDEGGRRVILRRGDKTVELHPREWVEKGGRRVLVFGDDDEERKVLVLREGDEHGPREHGPHARRVLLDGEGAVLVLEEDDDGDERGKRRRVILREDDGRGELKERVLRELEELDVDLDLDALQRELRGALDELPEGLRERIERTVERELQGKLKDKLKHKWKFKGDDEGGMRWVERLEENGPKVYREVLRRLNGDDEEHEFSFGRAAPHGEHEFSFGRRGAQGFAFRMHEASSDTDRVFLHNGDALSGTLERVDKKHAVLTTPYGKVEIDREHVARIVFRHPQKAKPRTGTWTPRSQPPHPPEPPHPPRPVQPPEAPRAPAAPAPARPFLGVSLETSDGEVRVTGVYEGSAAERAGVEAGDVILRVNGDAIESYQDLQRAIGELEINDRIKLRVRRGDDERNLRARLGPRQPAAAPRADERPQPRELRRERRSRSLVPQAPSPSASPRTDPQPGPNPGQKLYRF